MSMFPVKHKGALHRALGVQPGQKIPTSKMQEAKDSPDPHVRRMATYARNMQK